MCVRSSHKIQSAPWHWTSASEAQTAITQRLEYIALSVAGCGASSAELILCALCWSLLFQRYTEHRSWARLSFVAWKKSSENKNLRGAVEKIVLAAILTAAICNHRPADSHTSLAAVESSDIAGTHSACVAAAECSYSRLRSRIIILTIMTGPWFWLPLPWENGKEKGEKGKLRTNPTYCAHFLWVGHVIVSRDVCWITYTDEASCVFGPVQPLFTATPFWPVWPNLLLGPLSIVIMIKRTTVSIQMTNSEKKKNEKSYSLFISNQFSKYLS